MWQLMYSVHLLLSYLALLQSCEDLDVPIDSMFTHFADSADDAEFTRQQLDIFQEAVAPFR